jgi:hypothetical protein
VVDQVLIHGIAAGPHGLSVTLTPDYGQGDAITRVFTPAEVVSCTVGGQYVLSVSIRASMRALKVSIVETGATGEGFRPTNVTIVFAKNPTSLIAAVRDPGRK